MAVVGRSVNFIDMDPLLHFPLLGNEFPDWMQHCVGSTALADKPFCEFTDSGAGRNIVRGKG